MAKGLILSLCDYSGVWSDPYRQAGYEVMQIDLKHGQDVRLLKKLDRPVQGILCAPLCTAFSGAGARHWKAKAASGNKQLLECLALVDACYRIVMVHKPDFWVLENPVGRLRDWNGKSTMTFHPCDYAGWGETEQEKFENAYTKRTCLWGEFNEPEKKWIDPDPDNGGQGSKMWRLYGGKSERTKEKRSETPSGFAKAFFAANQ